jgi:hypothetical protein
MKRFLAVIRDLLEQLVERLEPRHSSGGWISRPDAEGNVRIVRR